jgi:hypothetical protein
MTLCEAGMDGDLARKAFNCPSLRSFITTATCICCEIGMAPCTTSPRLNWVALVSVANCPPVCTPAIAAALAESPTTAATATASVRRRQELFVFFMVDIPYDGWKYPADANQQSCRRTGSKSLKPQHRRLVGISSDFPPAIAGFVKHPSRSNREVHRP